MRLFPVVVGISIITLVAGFLRVWTDAPRLPPIGLKEAADWAQCLGSRTEIPKDTAVTIASLPAQHPEHGLVQPPAALALEFVTTAPAQVDLLDADLRAELEKSADGGKIRVAQYRTVGVAKGKGAFEFRLQNALVELRRPGARLLLAADWRSVNQLVRFGPADDTSYRVLMTRDQHFDVKTEGASKVAFMPVGARGSLDITSAQTLTTLHPLSAMPWPFEVPSTLLPSRAAGHKGFSDMSVEARQPGLRFDTPGLALNGCAWSRKTRGPSPVGVLETKAHEPGAATVTLGLPSGMLPAFSRPANALVPVELVVASSDGRYVSYGGFVAFDRGLAAIIATLLVGAIFWWLASLRHGNVTTEVKERLQARIETITARRPGMEARLRDEANKIVRNIQKDWSRWFTTLFMGADREPSLSLFQVFFWTVITVWGLAYVFAVTGSLLSLTPEMMALLGIAGTGSVLARWIGERGGEAGSPGSEADPEKPVEFWQILSTKGQFDLLKLQLLVFTLLIGVYVVWRIVDTGAFPALDTNTLLLLGVSQGVYIGGKLAGTTAISRAQTLKLNLELKEEERKKLEQEQATLADNQTKLKAAGKDLSAEDQLRLAALPELIKLKTKERDDLKTAYNTAVKELGLTTA